MAPIAFAGSQRSVSTSLTTGSLSLRRDVAGDIQDFSTISMAIEYRKKSALSDYQLSFGTNQKLNVTILSLDKGYFYYPLAQKPFSKQKYDVNIGGRFGIGYLNVHDLHLGGMYYQKASTLLLNAALSGKVAYRITPTTSAGAELGYFRSTGLQEISVELSEVQFGLSFQFKF
jgi:hypothetical protein